MTAEVETREGTATILWAKPADVAGALRAVLPHTSKDGRLPVLCAVHVVRDGDELIFEATDRYTVGRSTVQLDTGASEDGPVDFLLPVADAKRVLAFVKGEKYVVTIKLDGGRLTVSNLDGEVTARGAEGSFPSLGKILDNARKAHDEATGGINRVDFSGAFLPRFDSKHIARDRYEAKGGVRFLFGSDPQKAVLVTFSDHFVGAIVTRRQVD